MVAPILVLAPHGRDAEVIRLVLDEVGMTTRLCADLPALCDGLARDVTALILSEGALLRAGMEPLIACLEAQPPWSDLPVLVLTARGNRSASKARWVQFQRLGNVTLLDPPLHAEALQSAAQSALRARLRQYRIRTLLADIERANDELEGRVAERTQSLQTEMRERRKAEEALQQAQKMEAVGQLTGGIAHDFNNLLQVMLGNLHLLRSALSADEALLRHVTMAVTAGDRAAALTRHLLAFARRQPLTPRSLDLNALVAAMSGLIQQSVGESIRVDTALADGLWRTWADANQVESALLNLAINARDAMPDGGLLRVETSNTVLDETVSDAQGDILPGRYVLLRITDTGSGMPPDVLERAFEPFFTTKPIGQGSGLGLSQLYGFARQSGGHAAIRSQPGQGTTVSLYLPQHDGVDGADSSVPAVDAPSQDPSRNDETILVVEDEALVLMLWVEALEGQGYHVLQAAEPEAAIRILESDTAIDLLITDVGLPGMTGRDLAEVARGLRPGLRVLFVTGYAHYAALEPDSLGAGTRMLSKPVGVDTLQSTVRALLDGDSA
ncbi:response regulator (plasmid) [Azospirillum brasilense]|uniref:histidine kinase n=1 Tax=Azospirillum brasilense TaxID=192 RepID=A0A4D8RDD7_AZOBR|nr:ATP-binding protein [Azospirillum brasilense]QCO18736.1 response regulator [Azospirillum brasilense]